MVGDGGAGAPIKAAQREIFVMMKLPFTESAALVIGMCTCDNVT